MHLLDPLANYSSVENGHVYEIISHDMAAAQDLCPFYLLFRCSERRLSEQTLAPAGRSRQPLDFLYANIKHAFYQPCNGVIDTKVILHFSLKHPIMVGKKAHKEIQVSTAWSRRPSKGEEGRAGRGGARVVYGERDAGRGGACIHVRVQTLRLCVMFLGTDHASLSGRP